MGMMEVGEDARGEEGGCRTAFEIGTMEGGEDVRGKEGGCSICARHLKKSPKNQRPNKALYFPKGN